MGTSRNPAEMVDKIHKLAKVTEAKAQLAVAEGALATKTILLAGAATAGLRPGSKIAGRKWNVRYDVKDDRNPVALVRFTGPFHLVENPTKPHRITAKGLGGSRASRAARAAVGGRGAFSGQRASRGARALKLPGGFAAHVSHPGTTGKGIFPPAKQVAQRRVPVVMASTMKGAWRQVIR